LVFFKYSTDDRIIDDSEKEDLESLEQSSSSSSEKLESKNLLLKQIKLMFENGYFYTDIEKKFPKFYKHNKSKINFLYTQVLDERFKKDSTLEVQKDIDVYGSRQEKIKIIEKMCMGLKFFFHFLLFIYLFFHYHLQHRCGGDRPGRSPQTLLVLP
jgi:hypothetical protein